MFKSLSVHNLYTCETGFFVVVDLGFSSHIVEKFCRGFPRNWRSVLSQHDTRFCC